MRRQLMPQLMPTLAAEGSEKEGTTMRAGTIKDLDGRVDDIVAAVERRKKAAASR